MKNLTHSELLKIVTYNPITGIFYSMPEMEELGSQVELNHPRGHSYIRIYIRKHGAISAHRLAIFFMTGKWPEYQVNHKNGIRNDNSWNNLECVTRRENMEKIKLINPKSKMSDMFASKMVRYSYGEWS